MALDKILHVHKSDTAYILTTPEQQIFTLPPLPAETEEGLAKAILTMSILSVMIFPTLGISICIWERHKFKSFLMRICFPLYPVSK